MTFNINDMRRARTRVPSARLRTCRYLLLSTVLAASLPQAATTEPAWQSLYDSARAHYAARQYLDAEGDARRALSLAREGKGATRPYVASSLNLLAMARLAQGHGEDAVALLRQALEANQQALGDHPDTAAVALNLAATLDGLGQRDEALSAYRRSLDITDRLPPALVSAPVRDQALAALGRLYAERGDTRQAEATHRRLLQEATGMSASLRGEVLRRQAGVQEELGSPADAVGLLREALEVYERDSSPDPALVVQALTELAALYGRLGQFDDAAPLHQRAVDLLGRTGRDGPALAAHLNELGLWRLQRKEYGAAQALLTRARVIVEQQSPHGLDAALIVANLAQVHEAREQLDDAQALYQRSLAMFRALGDVREALLGQAQALNFLAGQDYRKRRFGLAEAGFKEALALTEHVVGPQSPQLLPLLDNLTSLYRSQQRDGLAAPYAERANRLRAAVAPRHAS